MHSKGRLTQRTAAWIFKCLSFIYYRGIQRMKKCAKVQMIHLFFNLYGPITYKIYDILKNRVKCQSFIAVLEKKTSKEMFFFKPQLNPCTPSLYNITVFFVS